MLLCLSLKKKLACTLPLASVAFACIGGVTHDVGAGLSAAASIELMAFWLYSIA